MNILTEIVAETRRSVAKRKARRSVSTLQSLISDLPPTLNFTGALRRSGLAFIAEIKRSSPSKGWIRQELDPKAVARQYEEAGASAISVLTDEAFFKGSLHDLAAVRSAVQIPLLLKDFVVDTYQLYEARAHGADAALLIAAVLSASELQNLQTQAQELGLECLVEIYEASELDKIDWDRTRILGVNNRDLRTFAVDIDHSVRLLRTCPPHVVRISESGLSSAKQLAHVARNGIDAVLIGESLMRAVDPGRALGDLRLALQEELLVTS